MEMKKIVFLILNYNACKLVEETVNTLQLLSEQISILIVDNASTDNSYYTLKKTYIDVKNVQIKKINSNLGYARGNNFGFKYIKQNYKDVQYVVVMNPDIVVKDRETIISMYEFLEKNEEYAIASCQVIFNQEWRGFIDYGWKYPTNKNLFWAGTFLGKLISHDVNIHYTTNDILNNLFATRVDVVSGCFFMARLQDLEKINWLDERTFLYYEENILSKKLESINKKEAIILNQFVYHNHKIKDNSLIDYKKRLFDRKYFHDSKMIYVNYYSSLKGINLILCRLCNNIDYYLKNILYKLLAFLNEKVD